MKRKKIISLMLAGTMVIGTVGAGIVSAAEYDPVEVTSEDGETGLDLGGGQLENPEDGDVTVEPSEPEVILPEEEIPEEPQGDVEPVEPEVEDPGFSDSLGGDVSEDSTDTEEIAEPVELTPTEEPIEEEIKDITFNFGECRYGSTISLMTDDDVEVATIRTEDGASSVEYYGGEYTVDGSSVTLLDVEESEFHLITDNDMMGSDVSYFGLVDGEGNYLIEENYDNPFWVISERFTLEESADVYLEFVNNSFASDDMLDKIDANPELMEVEEPIEMHDSLEAVNLMADSPETRAIRGKATLSKGDETFHYPWFNNAGTNEFYITHGKSGDADYWRARGVCAQAHLNSPAMDEFEYADWYAKNGDMTHPTADSKRTIIMLMLMLPGHVLEDVGVDVWKYSDRGYRHCLCHGAISWINAGTLTPDFSTIGPDGQPHDVDQTILNGIKAKYGKTLNAINKEICTLATTTYKDKVDQYDLYLLKCGDGTRQNVCFVRKKEVQYGYITVKKTSGNSAITGNNNNYSLKGAIYTVYSDKACTKKVGTMTTDANGNGKLGNLKLGTYYYVKETKASPGYNLDPNVYTVLPKA